MEKTPVIKTIILLLIILIADGSMFVCTGEENRAEVETASAEVVQVAAFMDSTIILKSDGTVWGCGDNSSGMLGKDRDKYVFTLSKLDGLENVGSVSMGNGYLLALKKDGTVWGIGNNQLGILDHDKNDSSIKKPIRIKELTEIQVISAGINYAMAMKNDGSVFLWGDYRYKSSQGQIHLPRKVKQAKGVSGISASRYNAYVIDNNSKTWFLRGYLHKPEAVVNLEETAHIYDSGKFTYGVSKDGSLWYWTINGQYAKKLEGVYDIERLTAYGAEDMIALDRSGFLWRWNEKDMKPYKISGIEAVKDFAAGNSQIVALKRDGTLWAWGENSLGQLGDGGALKVDGIEGVKYISTGNSHMVALKEDGTVWSWGSNSSGELGDGTYEDKLLPVQTKELKKVISVSSGNGFSMALMSNGTVWVWGNSSYMPKRSKKNIDTSKPVRVEELAAVSAIESGDECAMAVKRGGTVWGWGNNFSGQLGGSPNEDDNVREKPKVIGGCSYIKHVSIGRGHVLSVSYDGLVKAWGRNDRAQLGNDLFTKFNSPRAIDELKNIISVTATGSHSYATDSEGNVFAWGDNTYAQLGPDFESVVKLPVQVDCLAGIKQIVGRDMYTIALKDDGKLIAWGYNKFGQLGIGSKSDSFIEYPEQVTVP